MSTMFRDISSVSAMPGHIEPPSRVFGVSAGKTTFRPSLLPREPNRLNRQFGISNSVDYMPDQSQRTSTIQSTTLDVRRFGLQSRNLTSDSGLIPEGSSRFNQTVRQKINNTSNISKAFWPAVRNTTLTTGLQMQDSLRYNNDIIDNGGFRRPTAMRVIRGRNSTLSSRLLGSQNGDRHYKDLSNINGFNVSHIPRREMDTLSESRLPLSMRSCWMENQSISGSVLSTASMKAQFMNVLENLHHSILSIGPNVTTEAIRMEFDKAKEGLENINEISFAPTIRPAEAASVISQSSKYICPPISEQSVSNTINGGSIQLKSSTDLLKTLMSSKKDYINKFEVVTHVGEKEGEDMIITSSQDKESDDEEGLKTVFKKPKSYPKRRRSRRIMKIKVPQVAKNLLPKEKNKGVNLKEWYPIAVGSELALCGVDENGAPVKTEAVKKRLNSRQVELVSGLICNLIGSASTMVSALPRKIMAPLKNGLPDRWRVLQKELLNSQTAEEERKKRISKSPKAVTCSPKKKKVVVDKSPKGKVKEVSSPVVKVISSPKKKQNEIQTRSGRTVKPPSMFWLGIGSNEVTSSLAVSEKTLQEESSSRKARDVDEATSTKELAKPSRESPRKNERENEKSRSRKGKPSPVVSPGKGKKAKKYSPKKPKGKQSKAKSPKETKEESSEEVRVHSSTEDAKRQIKTRSQGSKRKREVTGDTDSVQAKKSKLENKSEAEVEVESTVETAEVETKTGKTKGGRSSRSAKSRRKKSPRVNNKKETVKKKTSKKVTESKNGGSKEKQTELEEFGKDFEMSDFVEFEKNFELKLDDIEIPEIANLSGNPQLSRSQLRLVSMETPPLKYFNNNLKLIRSSTTTPVRSPDWCVSQRTESEVKQFQRRREGALKKKIKMNVKREVITEKSAKTVQNRDVKRVMEWVAEKTVKSPQWNSKVLRYIIPSRKAMEEDNDEDGDTEFF